MKPASRKWVGWGVVALAVAVIGIGAVLAVSLGAEAWVVIGADVLMTLGIAMAALSVGVFMIATIRRRS